MVAYASIDSDGSISRGTTEINNWNWQNLFKLKSLLPDTPTQMRPATPFPAIPTQRTLNRKAK
jgi:hypothetical protein